MCYVGLPFSELAVADWWQTYIRTTKTLSGLKQVQRLFRMLVHALDCQLACFRISSEVSTFQFTVITSLYLSPRYYCSSSRSEHKACRCSWQFSRLLNPVSALACVILVQQLYLPFRLFNNLLYAGCRQNTVGKDMTTAQQYNSKKLISKWDSERIGTRVYQMQWNNAITPLAVQGHSRSPILVPIESPYATSY